MRKGTEALFWSGSCVASEIGQLVFTSMHEQNVSDRSIPARDQSAV